jgi:hypothetical protein
VIITIIAIITYTK